MNIDWITYLTELAIYTVGLNIYVAFISPDYRTIILQGMGNIMSNETNETMKELLANLDFSGFDDDIEEADVAAKPVEAEPVAKEEVVPAARRGKKSNLQVIQTRGIDDMRMEAQIVKNFGILDRLIKKSIDGKLTSLIISGAPGVGKSFPVEHQLKRSGKTHSISKGYAKATGVYEILYNNRFPNSVAVFDDIDGVFHDEVALNLFKTALDTTKRREISWLSSRVAKDENGEKLPKSFVFDGTVIFITNKDFDEEIESGSRFAPHLEALISRSHYVDMGLRTRRHQWVRIKQIAREGLFRDLALTPKEIADTLNFIKDNLDDLREASLRMALKVGSLRKDGEDDWADVAYATCVKRKKA